MLNLTSSSCVLYTLCYSGCTEAGSAVYSTRLQALSNSLLLALKQRLHAPIVKLYTHVCLFVFDATAPPPPEWATASSFTMFLDHTQRRATVARIPLDERSARPRDLYLTTHNTPNRQTSMPPVGFEHTISAGERPQTYALDRAATGTGTHICG